MFTSIAVVVMYSLLGPATWYQRLSKYLPFPFFLYYGSKYCPVLPNRVPILGVTGKPICPRSILGDRKVADGAGRHEPSAVEVQKVYEVFRDELVRLYYTHRPVWETRELRLLED